MQQLKRKLMMTLVLLMTAATGAWAQTETYSVKFEANGNSKTIENVTLPKTWACNYTSENGELDLIIKELYADAGFSSTNPGTSVTGGNGKVTVVSSSDQSITITEPFEGTATVTGQYVDQDWSEFTYSLTISIPGYVASAGTTVNLTRGTGDKANEWTMVGGMPAGNVTVNVEYYDYAELTAADAIAANNTARAQTDDLLATVAENPATGGTLMYYLTTDATFTQAQALALAETDWSSTVPTAKDIDAAGATVYLWYYIKGDDEHSDTDPVQLTVNVQPEPTYNVTFAEGVNPEAPADPVWTATPSTGVKKDQTVTVTYTGERKVIGVRAEKKGAAGKPVSEITPEDIFKVIASDGIIYDNIAAAESAGTVAQGLIVYVGSNTENENYNHGLALALNDENNNTTWGEAINACNAKNTSTPIVDALWILPSKDQWNTMFNAAGGDWKLRDCFSSAGGNNMVIDGDYWSSTGDSEWVWYFIFSGHDWEGTWGDIQPRYNYVCKIRAGIVF